MDNVEKEQDRVREFWNNKPCGSDMSNHDPAGRKYYEEIEQERYRYQYHIPKVMDWLQWRDKRILEIGTGVGTDARQIITRGGNYTGINVDKGSVDATRKALDVFALPGRVEQSSATSILLEDGSIDVVYSFGVLHHIPDVAKAVAEIDRVLRPGGELLIMLYNRSSINYQIEIRFLRKLVLRLLTLPGVIPLFSLLGFPREKLQRHAQIYRQYGRLSQQEWLNRNTDGPDNPYSMVYGKADAEALLGNKFRIVRNEVYYFEPRHWGVIGRLMPAGLVDILGRNWGWHRMVYAVKLE